MGARNSFGIVTPPWNLYTFFFSRLLYLNIPKKRNTYSKHQNVPICFMRRWHVELALFECFGNRGLLLILHHSSNRSHHNPIGFVAISPETAPSWQVRPPQMMQGHHQSRGWRYATYPFWSPSDCLNQECDAMETCSLFCMGPAPLHQRSVLDYNCSDSTIPTAVSHYQSTWGTN